MDLSAHSEETCRILECLLTSTTEGFLLLNPSGMILDANATFCGFSGYTQKELKGKHLNALLLEEGRRQLHESIQGLSAHEPTSIQMYLCRADGSEAQIEGNLNTPDLSSGILCLFCKDVSESASRKKDLRLATDALMAAANAVVITDPKGVILQVNRAFTRYTGYTMNEAVGQSTQLLNSGRHPDDFYREMWETIQRGEVWNGEVVNRRKDGSLYTEDMTITPIFSEEGEIVNYIAIKQDITDRKALEEMFLRAQRLESVGTLASGVAHDLNNVLSPIIMSADLMIAQTQDERTTELLSMIKEGAKRGADIVRQLLQFARGGGGEFSEVQIRHLLKELIKVYRETYPKSITIDFQHDRDLFPVMGDATQLSQIFSNLMINARDAMPGGGELRVTAENRHVDADFVKRYPFASTGEFTRVRIQDDGIGMSTSVQSRIFDAFVTTKMQGKGTGLGLPTSLSIVKNHEGFIVLESEEGVGTTFDVYLPSATEFQKQDVQPGKEAPPSGSGQRILVVDDEESIGFMLRGTLVSLGYQVEVATGGAAALDWVRQHPGKADLLMIDMMMPQIDGAEVIRTLREENLLPRTLIMSGMVSEDVLESTGIDLETNYIAKPFTIQELAVKLADVL